MCFNVVNGQRYKWDTLQEKIILVTMPKNNNNGYSVQCNYVISSMEGLHDWHVEIVTSNENVKQIIRLFCDKKVVQKLIMNE